MGNAKRGGKKKAAVVVPAVSSASIPVLDWRSAIVSVSPALAAEWLKSRNPNNRNMRPARIAAYVRDMRRGCWIVSPLSAIGFGEDGMLLNGHHRLHAVVKSGVECRFVVFGGLPMEVLLVTDQELPRTTVQVGKMFDMDTSFDSVLKVVSKIRSRESAWLSTNDLDEMREEFAEVISNYGEVLKSIRINKRHLRAGALAGFLLVLKGPVSQGGVCKRLSVKFLEEFAACCRVDPKGGWSSASINLYNYILSITGADRNYNLESANHVAAAVWQYANQEQSNRLVVLGDTRLRPYFVKARSKAVDLTQAKRAA